MLVPEILVTLPGKEDRNVTVKLPGNVESLVEVTP